MLKFIAMNVVVSKGYDDNPALTFSEEGNCVRFRIGKRVYDKREEGNYRWININVKAFGSLCERIRKMELKAGSFINIDGRYDEDVWQDKEGKTMRMPAVILSELEFAYSGNGKKNGENTAASTPPENPQNPPDTQARPAMGAPSQMPESFTGFANFGQSGFAGDSFGNPNPFASQS